MLKKSMVLVMVAMITLGFAAGYADCKGFRQVGAGAS